MKDGDDVENFREIDQISDDVKDGPALVDFYGNNCSSCRMLMPLVERFASEYQGRVRFYKLNIDDHMDLAEQYGVRTIPSLLFFKEGKEVDRHIGVLNRDAFREKIERLL